MGWIPNTAGESLTTKGDLHGYDMTLSERNRVRAQLQQKRNL